MNARIGIVNSGIAAVNYPSGSHDGCRGSSVLARWRPPGDRLATSSRIAGQTVAPRSARSALTRLEALIPDADDFDSLDCSFAQEALIAACSLLDALLDGVSTEKVALAARQAIAPVRVLTAFFGALADTSGDATSQVVYTGRS